MGSGQDTRAGVGGRRHPAKHTPPFYCARSLRLVTPLMRHVGASTVWCTRSSGSALVNDFILFGKSLRLPGVRARGSRRCMGSRLRFELQRSSSGNQLEDQDFNLKVSKKVGAPTYLATRAPKLHLEGYGASS